MKFATPIWLWALLAVPAIYWILIQVQARKRRQFEKFAKSETWRWIAPELDWGAKLRKMRFWILGFFFLILSLARPQWGIHEETVSASGLDIVLAMDLSQSMNVEDVVPNRLKKAKHIVRTLSQRLDGDRVGIIGFAASAYVACPLTTDIDYMLETIDTLNSGMVSNQGTDIGIALETSLRALERGAEENQKSGDNKNQEIPSRSILLISDGEDHEEGTEDIAKKIKAEGISLYIIGIGTQKGAPVPVRDETGALRGYKKDLKGEPVISRFNPDFLQSLAKASGGKYWTATEGEQEVEELLENLGMLHRSQYADRKITTYKERYQIPLFFGILCFLLEISIAGYRVLTTRRTATAAVLFLLISGVPAEAAQPSLDVYLENQKGVDAFKNGKVDEAKQRFGNAQARSPSIPELHFNQGVVQAQQEEWDPSIAGFQQAARGAAEEKNPRLEGLSNFNLGNVYSKKGDIQNAVQSYVGAIRAAQAAKDTKTEDAARKNLQLLIQQEQQQKSKGGQSSENQKDQQSKGNPSGDDNKDDQKNQNQKQQQSQKYKDSDSKDRRKQKFKSEKLTPEDADRVMAELASREKELNAKLKKQRGNPQARRKDW